MTDKLDNETKNRVDEFLGIAEKFKPTDKSKPIEGQGEIMFITDKKKKCVIITLQKCVNGIVTEVNLSATPQQARDLARTLRVRASQAEGTL